MIHYPLVVNEGPTIRYPCKFVPLLFSFGKGAQVRDSIAFSNFVPVLYLPMGPYEPNGWPAKPPGDDSARQVARQGC
jgi:hypothetical protein